jgi:hypothetical protein
MLILRATKKLRERIGPPNLDSEQSTTELGDWYATMLPWRPQVALLVNERTLLPVLMPLAPAATMPSRVAAQIGAVLTAHDAPAPLVAAEVARMSAWRIGPTANRSVVGILNEFTFLADTWRDEARPNLLDLAMRLAKTPCSPLYQRNVSPDRELAARIQHMALWEDHDHAGDDQGNAHRLLTGFREWLLTQVGCGDNLVWSGLILRIVAPDGAGPPGDLPPEIDMKAKDTLFRLLDEFL